MAQESSFPTWQELTLTVPAARCEEALARLSLLGFPQSWLEQPFDSLATPDGWQPATRDPEHVTIHLYADPAEPGAAERVREALGDLVESVAARVQATEDWLNTWREGRTLVPIGDDWVISPPWLVETAPSREHCVVIDPGLAFGAGDHPTTRDTAGLVLGWLRPGDRLLDLGAGSGVLSLVGLKLGAQSALAVELDALAAAEIPRNAALNGLPTPTVVVGDALELDLSDSFDLLLLNIGAHESRRLRPLCNAVAAPGARLLLSGLVEWAVDSVLEGYLADGWRVRERRQEASEWVSLVLTRD